MGLNRLVGKASALGMLAVLSAVGLSACHNAGTPVGAGAPSPTSVSSPAPVATTAPAAATTASAPSVVATPSRPAARVTRSYDRARVEWQGGATAISAEQGNFWSRAVADLTAGESTDSNPTGYPTAVAELTELIALPDGQQSPAQNTAYHFDIDALNAFFHTPGLYS